MFELDPRLAQDGPIADHLFSDHLVILKRNRHFPWLVVVPKIPEVSELFQLNEQQRNRLVSVVASVAQALKQIEQAKKINVEMLGNMVPQLHVHIIARKTSDVAWPNPVWRTPIEQGDYWNEAPESLFQRLGDLLSR